MDEVLSSLRPHLEYLARPFVNPQRPIQSTADLVQESCLRAWQKIGVFELAESDEETFALFRAWIGQILRRLGVDAQRARNRAKRRPPGRLLPIRHRPRGEATTVSVSSDPPARTPRPSAYARGRELDERTRAALRRMPSSTDATIVRMRIFEGLSIAQIARNLDLGYEMARDRYWAGVEWLKRELRSFR
jgi:RNA polymerase sigma factor (sigma-70 family)